MSYVDIVICVGPLPILETWPPIYRGQERTVRDRLKESRVYSYVYFRYTPCLTDFTFEFIRHPTPPILSPSYWTFVELTLITYLLEDEQELSLGMLIRCKRIYNFWCSMLVLHQLLYALFTLRGIFYAFSRTNLLTRCHSASSCFSYFSIPDIYQRKHSQN
jgi:hypothetical protein